MDKRRKKELLRQFKEREIVEARRKMCLWADELRDLHAYLEEQLFHLGIGCDHTLARTREWAKRTGHDAEAVVGSVCEFGGFCDCEVYYNVTLDKFGWENGGKKPCSPS
jgi:hypothetical protein